MGEIRDYNVSADSNTATPPNGAPEGMAPSTVNNTMREAYARIKRFYNDTNGANTTAGSGNTYTLSASRTVASYAAGDMYVAKFNHSNTGNSTINIDSVGAKGIVTPGLNELPVNSIRAGGVYAVVYEATADKFILLDSHPSENQINLKNPDSEDTAGGRESQIVFKGLQSGLEESTLGRIQASHEGTGDDEKGQLIFSTNDGSDSDSPTVALTIGSDQVVTFAKNPSGIGIGEVKNYILNPEFAVAQRGKTINATTPFTNANDDGSYILDQFVLLSAGSDTVDILQTSSDVPTGSSTALELDVEQNNRKFGIVQFLENQNCESIIGQEVTLSAQIKATSNLSNVRMAIISWSGSTKDAPTKDIVSAWEDSSTNPTLVSDFTYESTPSDLSVGTSFSKYSVSATVDTSSTKNIAIFIWSNSTGTTVGDKLHIGQVQLEQGSSGSDFHFEDYSSQFLKCARYFRGWLETSDDSANQNAIAQGHNVGTTASRIQFFNPVPLRATPTIDQNELLILSNTAANVTSISSIGTVGVGQNGTTFVANYSSTAFTNGGQVALFLDTAESGTSRCFISCELGV